MLASSAIASLRMAAGWFRHEQSTLAHAMMQMDLRFPLLAAHSRLKSSSGDSLAVWVSLEVRTSDMIGHQTLADL